MSAASDFDEGSVMSRRGFKVEPCRPSVVRRINPDKKRLSSTEQRVNEAETLS